MIKLILAAVAGLAAIAAPLVKWWLNQSSEKTKNQKEALKDAEEKIIDNAPVGDLQSDVDDILNGL